MSRTPEGGGAGRPTSGAQLWRAALGAAGWVLTAAGVVAIVLVLGGGAGRFSAAGVIVVATVVAVSALYPVLTGAAYLLVRRRNRGRAAADPEAVTPRARALQTSLASLLDRVDDPAVDALGLRRVVLTDRLELSAVTLREIDDLWEALSFIWFVRPSQGDDFTQSSQFRGLPRWAQDAVVLLDLRREVRLRGIRSAFSGEPGFYRHPSDRIVLAVAHTHRPELMDAVLDAQQLMTVEDKDADAGLQGQRLLDLIDDPRVWLRLVDEPA